MPKATPPKIPANSASQEKRVPENELDALLAVVKRPDTRSVAQPQDRVEMLRGLMTSELLPIFAELVDKYTPSGIEMDMDVSEFLDGGREIRFEFKLGEFRSQLVGTVTSEKIAFNEIRYSPQVRGELVSGPMLSVRLLSGQAFRDFICERLTILLRTAMRGR